MVDTLERDGLVERQRDDNDRRSIRLAITPPDGNGWLRSAHSCTPDGPSPRSTPTRQRPR
ncbi:MarR family transcriptional regulator [Micromonospora sp. M12]